MSSRPRETSGAACVRTQRFDDECFFAVLSQVRKLGENGIHVNVGDAVHYAKVQTANAVAAELASVL